MQFICLFAAGGGKECDVVEEVRPAALEASAHWTPGPWGQCRVAIETTSTPVPCKYLHNVFILVLEFRSKQGTVIISPCPYIKKALFIKLYVNGLRNTWTYNGGLNVIRHSLVVQL